MKRELGYFGFEHSYLSKAGNKTRGKSGPLHLSAVASYMSNINKTDQGIAVNLPLERGELYSELNRYSHKIGRTNGRLAETFIAYFDKRMTEEHRKEALGRFLMAVTFNGQIKARGWEHYDNPNNPHAHILVIDEDENGERVGHFGRSGTFRRENSPVKGNPTVWLRKAWQDECNAVLQEHGYDFRVDMRTKVEQQIERDQEARELKIQQQLAAIPKEEQILVADHVAVNPEKFTEREIADEEQAPEEQNLPIGKAPEAQVRPDEALPPDTPIDDIEESPEQEDEEAVEETMAIVERRGLQSTADILKFALRIEHERKYIVHLQTQRAQQQARLDTVTSKASEASLNAAAAHFEHLPTFFEEVLNASQLGTHQRQDGSLRGFTLGRGRFEWKSPARKQAEKALQNYESAKSKAEEARRSIVEHEQAKDRLTQEARELVDVIEEIDNSLKTYGTDKEVAEALEAHENSVYDKLNQLTVDQIEAAWEDYLITSEEAIEALELKGQEGALLAAEIEQWEADQEESIDQSIDI